MNIVVITKIMVVVNPIVNLVSITVGQSGAGIKEGREGEM